MDRLMDVGKSSSADDLDNVNLDRAPEDSSLIPWMLGGIFAIATLIGLCFGEESPLAEFPSIQITEHLPVLPPSPLVPD